MNQPEQPARRASTIALIVLSTPLCAATARRLFILLVGGHVPVAHLVLGAAAGFVLTLLGLFFFIESRTAGERSMVAAATLPALFVAWASTCRWRSLLMKDSVS